MTTTFDHGSDRNTTASEGVVRISRYRGELPPAIGAAAECHVLDDEGPSRLLTTRGIAALVFADGFGGLRRLVERIPGGSELLELQPEIRFRIPGQGGIATGYSVEFVHRLCDLIVDAGLDGALHSSQAGHVKRARAIQKAVNAVGWISLVDEATGYQAARDDAELRTRFAAYLHDELPEYAPKFTPEFYDAVAPLFGVSYDGHRRGRPMAFSGFIARYFYAHLWPEVYGEQKRRNPHPRGTNTLHRQLRPQPTTVLMNHMQLVTALARVSDNLPDFDARFNAALHGRPRQMSLFRKTG